MLKTKGVDLVVVGAGPAGMAAAVAAAEAGVEEIVLLERQAELGGRFTTGWNVRSSDWRT